jgi:hypothetical protein
MDKPGAINEPELRFESYKLIVEDLSRIREQRVTAIRSYLTLNSVILAATALLLRETQFVISWQALILVPLLLAGMIATLQWMLLIPEYADLVAVRVDKLKRIEKHPAMMISIPQLFNDEEGKLSQRNAEDRILRYVDQRRFLPGIFLILYVIASISVAVSVVLTGAM